MGVRSISILVSWCIFLIERFFCFSLDNVRFVRDVFSFLFLFFFFCWNFIDFKKGEECACDPRIGSGTLIRVV